MVKETGNGKCSQHIVLIDADAAVVVVAVEQSISKSEGIRFVIGLVGYILTDEVTVAVHAIIVVKVGIGGFVAEDPVAKEGVVELELRRAPRVKDRVVAVAVVVTAVFHLGFRLESQLHRGVTGDLMEDCQAVFLSP